MCLATLKDGSRVRVRPLQADDRAREAQFIDSLSAQSRYMRLMTPLRFVPPRLLDQLMDVDQCDRLALVATIDDPGGEAIVGVARYARTTVPHTAELAITVTDQWQRRGLATTLLKALADQARAHGIRMLTALILPDNTAMLSLAHAHGARVRFSREDLLMHADFDLDKSDGRLSREERQS